MDSSGQQGTYTLACYIPARVLILTIEPLPDVPHLEHLTRYPMDGNAV